MTGAFIGDLMRTPIDHVGVVLASVWTADLSAKLLKALLGRNAGLDQPANSMIRKPA